MFCGQPAHVRIFLLFSLFSHTLLLLFTTSALNAVILLILRPVKMPRKAFLGAIVLFVCVARILGIPNCSGGIHKGHMIQNIPYTGSYQDGEGTYVSRDNTSHPYIFPLLRECWWEYFTFHGEVLYTPWQQADGDT